MNSRHIVYKLTLVICLASALTFTVMWILTRWHDNLYLYRQYLPSASAMLYCYHHQFRISHWLELQPPRSRVNWSQKITGFELHIATHSTSAGHINRMVRLCLPLWFVIVVLMVYPSIVFVRGPLRRRRRRKSYQCFKCGYSLIGIEEPICPRCGEADQSPLCVCCGYNLIGNTTGICPECGKSVVRPHV